MNKIIIIFAFCLFQVVANAQSLWTGCGGQKGEVQDWCEEVMQINQLDDEASLKLKSGTLLIDPKSGETFVAPNSELRKGACCAVKWYWNNPCGEDAGNCNPVQLPMKGKVLKKPEKQVTIVPIKTKEEVSCDTIHLKNQVLGTCDDALAVTTPSGKLLNIKTGTFAIDTVRRGNHVFYYNLFVESWKSDTTRITTNVVEGEAITFGPQVITKSGTYSENFLNSHSCDSIVIMRVKMIKSKVADCPPCLKEKQKWLDMYKLSVSAYIGTEKRINGITNKPLVGFDVDYTIRFDSVLVKRDCWGEFLKFTARFQQANEVFTDPSCVGCNNIPLSDKFAQFASAQYGVAYLKGLPFVFSSAVGGYVKRQEVMPFNNGVEVIDIPDVEAGAMITPEVEWHDVFKVKNLSIWGKADVLISKNVVVMPSVGVRYGIK